LISLAPCLHGIQNPDEIKELLKTAQEWIREKNKGQRTVIQLPEE